MPGMIMSFNCPCGFQRDISVGTISFTEYYSVFLCRQCKEIFSIETSVGKNPNEACKECGMKLIAVTGFGSWKPDSLQQRFPDTEPWMIKNELGKLENDAIARIDNIRILCPNCEKYSLTFESTAFWD